MLGKARAILFETKAEIGDRDTVLSVAVHDQAHSGGLTVFVNIKGKVDRQQRAMWGRRLYGCAVVLDLGSISVLLTFELTYFLTTFSP